MTRKIFENFILIAIILVIPQTIIEEIALAYHFLPDTKNALIYSMFAFDLIFTIEFIIRLIWAIREKGVRKYLGGGLGWVDFLSSIPLLLLHSGPMLYLLLTHHAAMEIEALAVMNVLKIAKIIRVSRVLRLMRFLKLLKNLHFIHSALAQRHLNFIISSIISFIILAVIALNISGIWGLGALHEIKKKNYETLLSQHLEFSTTYSKDFIELLPGILNKDNSILSVDYQGKKIYKVEKKLSIFDIYSFEKIEFKNLTIYYIDYEAIEIEARFNLCVIIMILIIVAGLMLLYTRKFSLEIADTVNIVSKGISDHDYFIKLKESGDHNDEIDELSRVYNNTWLPLKLHHKAEIYSDSEDDSLTKKADAIDLESMMDGK